MSKEKRAFHRVGVATFSELSAFLGGIFFTSLLILVQQREKFDVVVLETNLQNFTIRISQLYLIAFPLSISVILFIFSSLFFANACNAPTQSTLERIADLALSPFIFAFLSMFISLFVVLAIVDIVVGLLGIIISVVTVAWFGYALKREEGKAET